MEYEALKKAIARVLQVYVGEIRVDSTFEGDLGADSIDMVQILQCVEEELKINLTIGENHNIVTVGDALAVIEGAVGAKADNE